MSDQNIDNGDVCLPSEYAFVCMDCAGHMIMDQRLIIKQDEYEQLKQVEEAYNFYNKPVELSEWRKLEAENARLKQVEQQLEGLKNFFNYLYHSKNKLPVDIEINADEILRLKRLENNVNKKIEELEIKAEQLRAMTDCPDRGFKITGEINSINDAIKLLRSLLK